jgi:hypothetical protein
MKCAFFQENINLAEAVQIGHVSLSILRAFTWARVSRDQLGLEDLEGRVRGFAPHRFRDTTGVLSY